MDVSGCMNEQAERAMKSARKTAGSMGRERIGTECLLLGLAEQGRSESGRMLVSAGVTGRRLKRLMRGEHSRFHAKTMPDTPTTNLKNVLLHAQKTAKGRIGTEDLLGAILDCKECGARRLLCRADANIEKLERLVRAKTVTEVKPQLAIGRAAASSVDKFGVDLTELARRGQLDPVIGREDEVFRLLTILTRRTKNNPVLLGDPGVGKTAIAEALAQAIADGSVPEELQNARIISLDMAGLISGTKYRGEFEERLRGIVQELKTNGSIIAFIDEIHTLVGAGAAEGAIDAANLLKPALARGEIRLIGTTTVEEYHKTIEKDSALDRRFQRIDVPEPDEGTAERILRGLAERYEKHHKVKLCGGVCREAVRLSVRISPERFLPDKAIDLLDEACAAAHLQGKRLVTTEDILQTAKRSKGWRELNGAADRAELMKLEQRLYNIVVGQEDAVRRICRAVRRGAAGLRDERRPRAALLLTGPTGVGKTSVCEALAGELFGQDGMIRIDLTEYQQPQDLSRLIGAPPGYKGYGDGGQLTEKIRRRPRSLVLFDEVEKAHPDVLRVLLRLLEDGRITDSEGRQADFRHAVVVLTSNLGEGISSGRRVGFGSQSRDENRTAEEVRRVLSTELTARLDDVIPFRALNKSDCERIAEIELNTLAERCAAQGIELEWDEETCKALGIADPKRGARAIREEVSKRVADELATMILDGDETEKIRICTKNGEINVVKMVGEGV